MNIGKNNNIIIYNKRQIKDILTCPICLEYYNDPRNLICGHSYCSKCLHLIKINNVIICPLCREINNFNYITISDLAVNSSLVSMIDIKKTNTSNINKKLKKSKSAECLLVNKNLNNSNNNIIYCNKPIDYDTDDDIIDDYNCCHQ